MKKIFLILLIPFILYANEINECQIDLYYANGVLMDKEEDKVKKYWRNTVENLKKDYPQLQNHIIVPKIAYNASELAGLGDFLEAFIQYQEEDHSVGLSWMAFKELISRAFKNVQLSNTTKKNSIKFFNTL